MKRFVRNRHKGTQKSYVGHCECLNHQISPVPPGGRRISRWHSHLHVGCMQAALSHRPAKSLDKENTHTKGVLQGRNQHSPQNIRYDFWSKLSCSNLCFLFFNQQFCFLQARTQTKIDYCFSGSWEDFDMLH